MHISVDILTSLTTAGDVVNMPALEAVIARTCPSTKLEIEMIVEVAELRIKPGEQTSFEAGVAKAAPLFLRAKGCHSVSLQRVVEDRSVYRLRVIWETVEDHMVGFRSSPDFTIWRELVGGYFSAHPAVPRGGRGDLLVVGT